MVFRRRLAFAGMVLRAAVRVRVGNGDISCRHMVALMDPYFGYRKIAGAVIAITIKDVAESLIFLRDIDSPKYREYMQKRADKAWKKYKTLLDNNAESKRWRRDKIKGYRFLMKETKAKLQCHREALENVVYPTIRPELTPEEIVLMHREISEIDKSVKYHTKCIATCKESIAEIEEKIETQLRKIKRLKHEESILLKRSSYKVQKNAMRNRALYEIECAREWFDSDQFERINAVSKFDPQELMEKTIAAVNDGYDTGDKPYYLRSTVEGRDNL